MDALVANTPEKTREIVLVFERPLEQPQQQQEEEAEAKADQESPAATTAGVQQPDPSNPYDLEHLRPADAVSVS